MDSGRFGMALCQPLPQLFGQERHGRMQQPQRRFKRRQQVAPFRIDTRVFAESQLLQLQVPVTKLVPEEVPQHCAAS